MTAATLPVPTTLASRVRRAVHVLYRILGAPDYDGYLRHACAHHAGEPPMSRDEFYRRRLEDRYSRPGSKCC
jgi:uncharacterized short protein YbdD (DUF466 family)